MSALLQAEGSAVSHWFVSLGVDLPKFKKALEAAIQKLPTVEGRADLTMNPELHRVLNKADKLSQDRKDAYISSELFILAAAMEKGSLGQLL